MLTAILARRKIVWQGQHKTGEQPCFHCGLWSFSQSEAGKKKEKKKRNENEKKNIL